MIELKALNPHWLGTSEDSDFDLCVHSPVWLKIADKVVSNEESGDWTISASAYLFLKSITEDHVASENEQLLPCCGFNFWKVENKIIFGNCGTGINWDIWHEKGALIHKFEGSDGISLNLDEWRNAVVRFTDEILAFYKSSPPRKFVDNESKSEFEFFLNELKRLRNEAVEKNA